MDLPDEPPALAYIEKTLADSYRKEIDQEENVWRSLPFFAATLALQMAALFQIIDKLPEPTSPLGWMSIGLLAMAGAMTLTSLWFLAASIYPQKFDYISKGRELLDYAKTLIHDEQFPEDRPEDPPDSALVTLKTGLAQQYAVAADHNHLINKRRERRRSIAGLAALGSVLMTVFLVATAYAHYLSIRIDKEPPHGQGQSAAVPGAPSGTGPNPGGQAVRSNGAGAAADAGRH